MSHRAVRVLFLDRPEGLASFGEPVRMQHRHAALELLLHRRVAGRREIHPAEFFRAGRRHVAGGLRLLGANMTRAEQAQRQRKRNVFTRFHIGPPLAEHLKMGLCIPIGP